MAGSWSVLKRSKGVLSAGVRFKTMPKIVTCPVCKTKRNIETAKKCPICAINKEIENKKIEFRKKDYIKFISDKCVVCGMAKPNDWPYYLKSHGNYCPSCSARISNIVAYVAKLRTAMKHGSKQDIIDVFYEAYNEHNIDKETLEESMSFYEAIHRAMG